jgi:UDP-N-acetylmuramoyl-L-alanyl-D-glutamate--2,6-diaminopimelate ligase
MEVSSHGLAQGRVSGIRFRGAVFTNLSRDHLDYHGDMAAYGAAKARLFDSPDLQFAVLNLDDAFGRELGERLAGRLQLLGYSLQRAASLFVQQAHYRGNGVDATVIAPCGRLQLHSTLLGDFNLGNLLAVAAVLEELGFDHTAIEQLVPRLLPIPGRMERVPARADIDVVVDYAHTPDALEQALRALRRHCAGKLWAVFGCGGDRDRGKRPLMGAVAERLADHVLLTSDNPRGEAPRQIVDDIAAGCGRPPLIELDRARAIERALLGADAGDCVLLAGKGHEDYQESGGVKRPFSDIDCARSVLARRATA